MDSSGPYLILSRNVALTVAFKGWHFEDGDREQGDKDESSKVRLRWCMTGARCDIKLIAKWSYWVERAGDCMGVTMQLKVWQQLLHIMPGLRTFRIILESQPLRWLVLA